MPESAPHAGDPTAIRTVAADDMPGLRRLIDDTGLFPSALLDGMLAPYLGGEPDAGDWLTIGGESPVAVAYVAPERMTSGTWNLYLIAVHPAQQGLGRGTALVAHVEATLAARGQRLLLVETSGLPAFARTQAFYRRCGFHQEARIRDFYAAGEDKLVFSKPLAAGAAPT
jgi:ribosomal protein S18 acetylase RimI-like enzyme